MLTSSIITLAKKQFPDWSRQMLLEFLDELQRMAFTQNTTNQMRMYDSSTGKDPVLTTVAGTYSYDINTDNGFEHNAWRVTHVYSSDENDPMDVTVLDATASTPARVIFKESVSGDYYIRAYRFPTELSVETVQLEIPEAYHITHIFEGLSGLIEQFRSGKSERYDRFILKLLPDLLKKMGENHTRDASTPIRGY